MYIAIDKRNMNIMFHNKLENKEMTWQNKPQSIIPEVLLINMKKIAVLNSPIIGCNALKPIGLLHKINICVSTKSTEFSLGIHE